MFELKIYLFFLLINFLMVNVSCDDKENIVFLFGKYNGLKRLRW